MPCTTRLSPRHTSLAARLLLAAAVVISLGSQPTMAESKGNPGKEVESPTPPARRGGKAVEIEINGPFEADQFYFPEDLTVDAKKDDFQFLRLFLDTGKNSDNVFVRFTFAGKEAESRRMKVQLVANDNQGREVARDSGIFEDPRIVARRPQVVIVSKPLARSETPHATVRLSLPDGMRIDDLGSVKLLASELAR